MTGRNDERLRCSFCGKTQDQVRKLIAGPNGAYICADTQIIANSRLGKIAHENVMLPECFKYFF